MDAALRRHDQLLRSAIESADGYVFKTVGDAFCAAFASAGDAVEAVRKAQHALHAEAWPEHADLRVRMAIHSGECEERYGDYFGPTVNRTARLEATAHGGQVILSQATAFLVRDRLPLGMGLRFLGSHHLKDLDRSEEVFQLEIEGLDTEFPPLRSLDNRNLLHNLPQPVSRFVGREIELVAVSKLLETSRLVTLTGSGGSGKTRLALQVAAEIFNDFSDGVWLVELESMVDPELVTSALASAFKLREEPGRPLIDTLVNALSHRHMVVVLDNCEHLCVAVAALVDSLLRACPRLCVLATSREPLAIDGEQAFRVPSLSLPEADEVLTAEQAVTFDAVHLFVDRAVGHQSQFLLDDTNATTVVSLCRSLDGIPLAIELAAARITFLSVADIEQRLDDRFRLLTASRSTALPRHQTLGALIDWSYDLLGEREQLVLCQLSVFAGGWTVEAAEELCSHGPLEAWEVVNILGSLVDKSLVQGDVSNGGIRYRQLDTIRRYSAFKLSRFGQTEEASTRRSHARVFLALAKKAAPQLSRRDRAKWFDQIELELDNLRTAMAHFASDPTTADQALEIGVALRDFWFCGFISQGIEALQTALSVSNDKGNPGLRAAALLAAGYLQFEQGSYELARAQFERVMDAGPSTIDSQLKAEALGGLSLLNLRQGDLSRAMILAEQSVTIAQVSGDPFVIADAFNHRGAAKSACGDSGDRADFDRALAGFRTVDNRFGIVRVLQSLAIRELKVGSPVAAKAYIDESLKIDEEMSVDGRAFHASLQLLGLVELLNGDSSAAFAAYSELLTMARRLGTRPFVAYAFLGMAFCATSIGDADRAALLHGAADALFESLGETLDLDLQRFQMGDHRHLRRTMGNNVFDSGYEAGRRLSSRDAIELALRSTSTSLQEPERDRHP